MPALLDSDTFGFANGASGHVCDLGSAPAIAELDVLCVNSDTTVSTPSGFTAAETAVGNQGAYVFTRLAAGGEGSTVTVTTSGNFNALVSWSRWSGTETLDVSVSEQANASTNTSSPAINTGALAETGELVVAFSAMHSTGGGNQTSPVWSSGYDPVTSGTQSAGVTAVAAFVGYKTGAGTAAETPSVSWSGDGCFDRYMLVVSFTSATAAQAPQTRPRVAALVQM